mmetsp:Transcript_61974/g.134321  ORF Transcript_61974/g.134321 Transcript_61974/m.134321 type:complete len:386 (-) Transcript_61974:98-1255(-)
MAAAAETWNIASDDEDFDIDDDENGENGGEFNINAMGYYTNSGPQPNTDSQGKLLDIRCAPTFLEPFGFSARSYLEWFEEPAPRLSIRVTGHSKAMGITYYHMECSLTPEGKCLEWHVDRRLQQLREELHDFVKRELGKSYRTSFDGVPFARRVAVAGTTARLEAWCGRLAEAISSKKLPPCIAARTLAFLDVPAPAPQVVAAASEAPAPVATATAALEEEAAPVRRKLFTDPHGATAAQGVQIPIKSSGDAAGACKQLSALESLEPVVSADGAAREFKEAQPASSASIAEGPRDSKDEAQTISSASAAEDARASKVQSELVSNLAAAESTREPNDEAKPADEVLIKVKAADGAPMSCAAADIVPDEVVGAAQSSPVEDDEDESY